MGEGGGSKNADFAYGDVFQWSEYYSSFQMMKFEHHKKKRLAMCPFSIVHMQMTSKRDNDYIKTLNTIRFFRSWKRKLFSNPLFIIYLHTLSLTLQMWAEISPLS